MKKILLILISFLFSIFKSQSSTESVPISYTNSPNSKFNLKSISYDETFPTLRGESIITYNHEYESLGVRKTYYKINRSFDLYNDYPFFLAISNDGRKIVYIKNRTYFKDEEHKNVTYYLDGNLVQSYDTDEFINCNKDKEKCEMFYENTNSILDYRKSTSTVKVYKDNISDKERFLNRNFVFNKNDTIYIVDSRKMVTLFDLNTNRILKTKIDFDSLYPKVKNIESIKSQISYYKYPYKYINDIQNNVSNEKLSETISKFSGLKFISIDDATYPKYKLNEVQITGYLNRNGKFEIEIFKADEAFNYKKIKDYLETTIFMTDFIPKEVDRIYLGHFFGGYRSFDDKIAEIETIKEKNRQKEEFKKRLTLEKINDIYIPKNLYECMRELDKTLNFESKKKLKEAENSFEYSSHLGGLGMWIRNNWGINGGSRLLKYFNDRGVGKEIYGNETISGLIIEEYIKWLKGDKDSWEKWENIHPIKK
ncbi:DUF6794 domain-containing protein [Chryseobacterium sp. CH25]|uniref:DUF6794 domain-containing protein n=1 Tax=Chryseobacterium sp. CH25 TaxID=713559 RepID=UPI00100B4651|nr:DUF6794 domain-containing protein [Chryseobacterium sp. CH25]RXM52371.1 hypothetical protein BOQ64_05665 [Chryseobacterium sp. CH25]